ncbi:MAG: hypothetical protein V7655_13685 [Aequorivita antarctica]
MMSNNKITIDMFTQNFNIKRFIPIALAGVFTLLLTSCGTYNNGYNENDGIYASGNNTNTEEGSTNVEDPYERSNYYKQYFQSKSNAYSDLPEEGAIFTDIDAYSTTESLDEEGNIIIEENYNEEGYGSWGNNAENVTINIYNSGGYGFYHNPYWYGGYWGWGYPYYGYSTPYWGISYGWSYPYYGYGYGYGYGYPYYGYGNYNPYYNNSYYNGVSYNRGRRNTDYNRTEARGRSNVSTRNSSYSRSETARRINRNDVRANTTRSTRSGTIRSNNVRTTSPNSTRGIRNTPSNTTRSGSYSQPTRSNNTVRSTTPSTRSSNSGSVRSSGSSGSSSSGSTRSSGGGRGGRG